MVPALALSIADAFLSARNDTLANIAIIGWELLAAYTASRLARRDRRACHRGDERRCRICKLNAAAKKLMRLALEIPVDWTAQRKLLGFHAL